MAKGEPEKPMQPKARPSVSISYIKRDKIQCLISEKLLPDNRERQPRCVLRGLGGAGKTQLALKWIQDNKAECDIQA